LSVQQIKNKLNGYTIKGLKSECSTS